MAKLKAGDRESHNHYLSNPAGRIVTSARVMGQVEKYNQVDMGGHLYGAIIASVRDYIREKRMPFALTMLVICLNLCTTHFIMLSTGNIM